MGGHLKSRHSLKAVLDTIVPGNTMYLLFLFVKIHNTALLKHLTRSDL